MKKTIKQLENELAIQKEKTDRYYSDWVTLKDEKEGQKRNQYNMLEESRREVGGTVQNLMEVIRWHINPETARTPFMSLVKKDEVDGRERRN